MKKVLVLSGWIGVLAILSAFSLNLYGYFKTDDLLYIILNIVGSFFIVIASLSKRDYPSSVLNVIWALFGIGALFRVLL